MTCGIPSPLVRQISRKSEGLSLQTQHSPLYPLLSLPLRICIQSIIMMLSITWYLLLPRTFFPFIIPSRASFSRQFLLSQWPSLSSTTFLFCLSIFHAQSFSIFTSQTLSVVFAHSVVMSKSLHQQLYIIRVFRDIYIQYMCVCVCVCVRACARGPVRVWVCVCACLCACCVRAEFYQFLVLPILSI